jgi:hypothetical protein
VEPSHKVQPGRFCRPKNAISPTAGIAVIPAAPRLRARPERAVPLDSFAERRAKKSFFDRQVDNLPVQKIEPRRADDGETYQIELLAGFPAASGEHPPMLRRRLRKPPPPRPAAASSTRRSGSDETYTCSPARSLSAGRMQAASQRPGRCSRAKRRFITVLPL